MSGDTRQSRFAWTDPDEVLHSADGQGEVLYEAPPLPRPARTRRPVPTRPPESLGLPFGVDASGTCWSCGVEVRAAVRTGPGYAACPGCGAKLPFGE